MKMSVSQFTDSFKDIKSIISNDTKTEPMYLYEG